MNNLQPLKWRETSVSASARTPMHSYEVIATENNKFYVKKVRLETQKLEEVTGFDTAQAAKDWCFNEHYAVKMQPYVKPAPTWVDVEKRLPEQNTEVLVRYRAHFDDEEAKEFDVCTAFFHSKSFDIKDQNFYTKRKLTVVAWMPIPKFSKQGE